MKQNYCHFLKLFTFKLSILNNSFLNVATGSLIVKEMTHHNLGKHNKCKITPFTYFVSIFYMCVKEYIQNNYCFRALQIGIL